MKDMLLGPLMDLVTVNQMFADLEYLMEAQMVLDSNSVKDKMLEICWEVLKDIVLEMKFVDW